MRVSLGHIVVLALLLGGCAGDDDDDQPQDAGPRDAAWVDAAPRDGAPSDAEVAVDAAVVTTADAALPDAAIADAGPDVHMLLGVDASASADADLFVDGGAGDDAALPCIALPLSGVLNLAGDSTTAPTWNRPDRGSAPSCPYTARHPAHTAVHRDVWVLCNPSSSARRWDIAMGGADDDVRLTHPDPLLFVYTGAPIAPDDELSCLADADDFGFSTGALIPNLQIPAGGRISVYAGGYANDSFGTYRLQLVAR